MRILVVGCGSVGRRHAENARQYADVGILDIDAARADDMAKRLDAFRFDDWGKARAWQPDGVVIASPTADHLLHARQAIGFGAAILIEKPISHDPTGVAEMLATAEQCDVRVFVGCNMRYHPGPATLHAALGQIGKPLFARAQYGSYLPAMRPGIDYRTLYVAHTETGGGVILDSIHEIDYLGWLLGPIASVTATSGRISDLEIEAEDYAALALRHVSGCRSEIHLDYVQQFKRRGCEIVGTEGTLIWSSEGKSPEHCSVRLFRAKDQSWETLYESKAIDSNLMYAELMRRFSASISSEPDKTLQTGVDAYRSLVVATLARSRPDAYQHHLDL
ncbi:MAG: Gfo/Idh/MocA family oxidoreductase [Ferrovibrio sp.]